MRSRPFAQVIVAAGSQSCSRLARRLHRDPVHRLHHRLGDRVVVCPLPADRAAVVEEAAGRAFAS